MIAMGMTSLQLIDYKTAYQEGEIEIKGIVISEKKEKLYKTIYEIQVESVNGDTAYQGKNIFLNCKKGKNKETVDLKFGDFISFQGDYEKPSERRNEGGFDYASYLRSIKIYGNVILTGNITVIEKDKAFFFSKLAYQFRKAVRGKVQSILKGEKGSLLLGLLIGDISGISDQTQEYFRDSSLTHLLAVSGAQVSYILMGAENMLGKLKIGKQKARVIATVFLLFFLQVTGFSASVTRAGIMGIVTLLAGLFHRKPNTWHAFFFSLLLLMLHNPFCIFDLGLQLSFAGTAGILLFHKKIKEKIEKKRKKEKQKKWVTKIENSVMDMLVVTLSAQIMIFPITLYQFGTVSFTFFLSNLFAGLLISPITFLGCFFCFTAFLMQPLAKLVAFFLNPLLTLLVFISKYSSFLPFSKIYFPIPSLFIIFLYYAFLIYFILPIFQNSREKIRKRIQIHIFPFLCCICILVSLQMIFSFLPNDFKLHFIDVGQGDSTLILSPYGKKMLIDGGGSRKQESFDVGEQTLLPYLLKKGITTLDYVMISHFDADHCNGLISILENLKVKCVILSKQASLSNEFLKIAEIIEEKKISVMVVEAGMEIYLDKTTKITILHPQKTLLQDGKGGLNCNAIVAKVSYQTKEKDFSVLFTGDIEEEAEKLLLEKGEKLKADILKVGHHGSKTSSTKAFLEVVEPQIALIGVGEKNTFGHPNPQVMKRLQEQKIQIYRTDQQGEISITIKKNADMIVKTQIKE